MALEALLRASRVSLLMFAVSMLAIWPSRFMIWADVCSRVDSSCFFFLRAALAAASHVSMILPVFHFWVHKMDVIGRRNQKLGNMNPTQKRVKI